MKLKIMGFIAIGMIATMSSLLANSSSERSMNSLMHSNSEVLSESATYAKCDTTTDSECTFWTTSGITGRSSGVMHVYGSK